MFFEKELIDRKLGPSVPQKVSWGGPLGASWGFLGASWGAFWDPWGRPFWEDVSAFLGFFEGEAYTRKSVAQSGGRVAQD